MADAEAEAEAEAVRERVADCGRGSGCRCGIRRVGSDGWEVVMTKRFGDGSDEVDGD